MTRYSLNTGSWYFWVYADEDGWPVNIYCNKDDDEGAREAFRRLVKERQHIDKTNNRKYKEIRLIKRTVTEEYLD